MSSTSFPICGSKEESMEYTLFLCEHTKAIWFGSSLGFLSHVDRNIGIMEWWSKSIEIKDDCGLQKDVNQTSLAIVIWWAVWKARNNFIF